MLSDAFSQPLPSRSDRARDRLLKAALEVFGEKGPDGATVRDIARAAGQNVAAIAYYFGSKKRLYHAVMEGLVREIKHRLGDYLAQYEQLRQQPKPSTTEATRLLKLFLGGIYLRLLSRKEAIHITRLIVREQLGPTDAFEILYGQGFRQLHESLCFLVGVILGSDPRGRETILRTHMVMGQVYFFAMSREAILRRSGWTTLEGKNAELVVQLLEEHIEILLSGLTLAATRRPENPPDPASKSPHRRPTRPGTRPDEPDSPMPLGTGRSGSKS